MPAAATADIGITGMAVYGVVYGAADRSTVWNGSAFVAYSAGSRNAGSITASESPIGFYTVVLPGGLPAGTYYVQMSERVGGSPDESDPAYTEADPVSVSAPPPAPASDGRLVSLGWGLPAVVGPAVRLAAGEDVRLTFAPAAGTDPADLGSAVQFVVRHPLTGAVALTAAGGSLDPDAGTVAVDLASAITAVLTTGLGYPWDLRRTDSGAQAQLARGRLLVMPPTP